MLKRTHRKFFSAFLFLVMLCVAVTGTHRCAHAMQCRCEASAATDDGAHAYKAAADDSSAPEDQQHEAEGCDTCVNCACHTLLGVPPLHLAYNPVVLDLITFHPYQHLPEVYLSKFIPPQIRA